MSSESNAAPKGPQTPAPVGPVEKRGVLTEVIVPIAASGTAGAATGAASAIVSNALKGKKDK